MKFERYLHEQYYDALQIGSHTFEIFINPSKKEIKEVSNYSGRGYRFIIDFKQKKFYVWADVIFHEVVMDFMKEQGNKQIPDFQQYWYKGKMNDTIFTGSSDVYGYHSDHMYTLKKNGDLEKLLKLDMSWLSRYIDVDSLRSLFNEYQYNEQ